MRKLLLTFALFLAPAHLAHAVGASWPVAETPRFWLLGESSTHLNFEGSYFATTQNYDQNGLVVQPVSLQQLRYTNIKFHVGHGFGPKVSLFAQLDGRGLFAKNANNSNYSDTDNYGPGDVFLGLRWLLYRSRASDRVYPTEWAPDSFLALAEGTWVFPLYQQAMQGKPPLGEQSNDFTGLLRFAWYANDWLALSGSLGYTYRTAGYSAALPWNARADFALTDRSGWRFWADLSSTEGMTKSAIIFNPSQPDPIPSGSLLFKSYSPTIRMVTLGAGLLLSKQWEMVVAPQFTASGVSTAKGFGGTLGFAWRPYQVPEINYEQYRKEQIERLKKEPNVYRKKPVLHFGLSATIIKVSPQGNYFKIAYGQKDGVKQGDNFQIFAQDMMDGKPRRALAIARVAVARVDESFLRVEQKLNEDVMIQAGQEARRVIVEE